MVDRSSTKLILILVLMFISNTVLADVRIFNLNSYKELPSAGQSMELFFEVEAAAEGEEYYLLSNLDDQSSMLSPAIKEPIDTGIKLRFDLPAPILTLSYSLIVKRGLEIVAGSDTIKLERDCFPVLGAPTVTVVDATSSEQAETLFRQAKKLENDFANYSQIFFQLDHLKGVLEKE